MCSYIKATKYIFVLFKDVKECMFFFLSYDMNRKVMDRGYPKQVQEIFSGMTSKVTSALQEYGEYLKHFKTSE